MKKYEPNDSEFLHHCECSKCGSSDANGVYSDGHEYCYACDTYIPPKKEHKQVETQPKEGTKALITTGSFKPLVKRGITLQTARKWGYEVGKFKGKSVQIANYYDDNRIVVTQKVRFPNKDFLLLGESKCPLYGQWLWNPDVHGRSIIIVEGEIDALSVSQVYNHRRPVVSIPKGAKGAKKDLQRNLEFLNKFNEIILAFDNDEAGKEAIEECAKLFQAGKVRVCIWSEAKDANEKLQKEDLAGIVRDIKEAKVWRPDGIINGDDIDLETLTEPMPLGIPYPYPILQEMTYGSRGGELIIWTAGSGIGKSTILRELSYYFVNAYENVKVGMIFLEESMKKTAQAFIALDNNIPLAKLRYNPSSLPTEKWEASKEKLFNSGKVVFYKHFGSLASDTLLEKIRYMVVGLGVTHIFLDHLSIVISGNDSDNERKDIDMLMTELRSLVEETGCHVDAIVHLKRTSGKGSFNEGAQVSLTDLRGSASLEQLSDAVIALERNQQAQEVEGESERDVSQIRILKNREIGIVGPADRLKYSHETGRLIALELANETFTIKHPEEGANDDF